MTQEELLKIDIWCPNILDESIIVYLNLGSRVLLTDKIHAYLLWLDQEYHSSFVSPYKLYPVTSEDIMISPWDDQFGMPRIKWNNQYVMMIPIDTSFRDKLEHAINLNMFKH